MTLWASGYRNLLANRRRMMEAGISSGGPAYYVDATLGNDANDGTSSGLPWKTIAKVNGESFNAGDRILLKRGETWAETLTIPSSGIAAAPIVFGAYGSGTLPVIDGGSARANCINVAAKDYITIQDIKVQDSTTINLDGNGDTVSLTLKRVESSGGGGQGIWFDTGGGNIRDCTTSGATAWGLVINTSGAYTISNSTISNNGWGFLFRGSSTGTIASTVSHSNTMHGFSVLGTAAPTFVNCTSYGNTDTDAVGFRCGENSAPVFEDCTSYSNGGDGFDQRDAGSTMTCRRCLSHSNGTLAEVNSGDGFTAHDGALIMEYCIGYGNIKSGAAVVDSDFTAYNCSFYDNNDGNGAGWISNLGIGIRTTGTVILKNNITQGHEYEVYVHDDSLPGLTLTSDYNCFYDSLGGNAFHYDGVDYNWVNWKIQSGEDANSLNENPDMVNPGAQDFHLQAVSPCRNVGTDVSLTEDYDGVSVPQETNPAIGVYEYVA